MNNLNGKVAVVTGAASGIGRALAQNLAKQGCQLALSDIRMTDLNETRATLGLPDNKILCCEVDVSDLSQMEEFANKVVEYFGRVDIVINNAGISCSGTMEETNLDTFRKVIDINLWGVVYGSRLFLPHLRKQNEASLVNISSFTSVVPFPDQAPYNMSKSAVHGLNETLMMELKDTNVKVLSIHPGAIKTNIANFGLNQSDQNKAAFEKVALTTPDRAAKIIIKGIKKKKSHIFVGADAKIFQFIKRLNPNLALRLIDWVIRDFGKKI